MLKTRLILLEIVAQIFSKQKTAFQFLLWRGFLHTVRCSFHFLFICLLFTSIEEGYHTCLKIIHAKQKLNWFFSLLYFYSKFEHMANLIKVNNYLNLCLWAKNTGLELITFVIFHKKCAKIFWKKAFQTFMNDSLNKKGCKRLLKMF